MKYKKVNMVPKRYVLFKLYLHLREEEMSLCINVQVTLSGRDTDNGLSVKMIGAQIYAIPSSEAEGTVFY